MTQSDARVATEMATRYLGQICKHFEHRRKVEYAADFTSGRIEFEIGVCTLRAEPGLLMLHAEAPDDAALERLQDVVVRHLDRFAFRDKPDIGWQRVTD